MGSELLEIEPRELKFTFELKKQSSCSVRLANKSNEYVAFKVKTTNPKRYCVRPNTGVVLPRSTCDFTVTMQAQRVAPPDMQLKDKFLVQTTAVPFGTTDEEIVPSFFSKENGRYIEEHKLRVSLSPPHSPVSHPVNGASKQEPAYENLILKETPSSKEEALNGIENDELSNRVESLHPIDVAKDVEGLMLKLNNLEMKLIEADRIITVLREEKSVAIQEIDKFQQEIADKTIPIPREEKIVAGQDWDKLQQEIVLLRRKCASGVQVGFPLMFVVFIALVGVALGYLLHP